MTPPSERFAAREIPVPALYVKEPEAAFKVTVKVALATWNVPLFVILFPEAIFNVQAAAAPVSLKAVPAAMLKSSQVAIPLIVTSAVFVTLTLANVCALGLNAWAPVPLKINVPAPFVKAPVEKSAFPLTSTFPPSAAVRVPEQVTFPFTNKLMPAVASKSVVAIVRLPPTVSGLVLRLTVPLPGVTSTVKLPSVNSELIVVPVPDIFSVLLAGVLKVLLSVTLPEAFIAFTAVLAIVPLEFNTWQFTVPEVFKIPLAPIVRFWPVRSSVPPLPMIIEPCVIATGPEELSLWFWRDTCAPAPFTSRDVPNEISATRVRIVPAGTVKAGV